MNTKLSPDGLDPFNDPLDRILAEIALSIQLPPSLHEQAKGRYDAVRRHLEATPAFQDQIEHFYPQGSMAIDATISTRGTDDEYDLVKRHPVLRNKTTPSVAHLSLGL